MEQKHSVYGEFALVLAVVINSFGVVLMLYSGSGISAISSVPYAFSEVFTRLSLGTWTYIFQGLLTRREWIKAFNYVTHSIEEKYDITKKNGSQKES